MCYFLPKLTPAQCLVCVRVHKSNVRCVLPSTNPLLSATQPCVCICYFLGILINCFFIANPQYIGLTSVLLYDDKWLQYWKHFLFLMQNYISSTKIYVHHSICSFIFHFLMLPLFNRRWCRHLYIIYNPVKFIWKVLINHHKYCLNLYKSSAKWAFMRHF